MKNKKLTYFLVLVVVAVWGMIIYRVFESLNIGDDLPETPIAVKKEVYDDYELKKDTAKLLLNYRDPFGLTKQKDTVATAGAASAKPVIIKKIKPAIDWSFITYSGYIRNPETKKLIAILTIHDKRTMLAEGEVFERVKLLKNMRDSVKVGFAGAVKYIVIRSGI